TVAPAESFAWIEICVEPFASATSVNVSVVPLTTALASAGSGAFASVNVSESPLVAISTSEKTFARLMTIGGASSLTILSGSAFATTGGSLTAPPLASSAKSTDAPWLSVARTVTPELPFWSGANGSVSVVPLIVGWGANSVGFVTLTTDNVSESPSWPTSGSL